MNDTTKLKLFFVLKCVASGIIIMPLYFLSKNKTVIAAQPTPDMFVEHMLAFAVGVIIGKPLLKYTKLRISELSAKLLLEAKSAFLSKVILVLSAVVSFGFIYQLIVIKNDAKNLSREYSHQSVSKPQADIKKTMTSKPSFQEYALARHQYADSMWGTCTFVLFKEDKTSGGTKMYSSIPTCIAKFKEYFQKYACQNNLDIKGAKQTIKSGQINFGKELNYERRPAAGYSILVSAECVEEFHF